MVEFNLRHDARWLVTYHTSVGQVLDDGDKKTRVRNNTARSITVCRSLLYRARQKCCRSDNEVKCTTDTRTCQAEYFDLFILFSQGRHEHRSLTTGDSLPHTRTLSSGIEILAFIALESHKPGVYRGDHSRAKAIMSLRTPAAVTSTPAPGPRTLSGRSA
jgi:hypothetical protein